MTTLLPKDSDTPVALVASTLDPQTQQILNAFADTMIALRIPGQPLAKSNPQIGNQIATALNSATTAAKAYTPSTPSNWAGTPPTTVAAALDRVAAALVAAGHTP